MPHTTTNTHNSGGLRWRLLGSGSLAALIAAGAADPAQARSTYPSFAQALRLAAVRPNSPAATMGAGVAASRAASAGVQALLQGAVRFHTIQQALGAQALRIVPNPAGPVADGVAPAGLQPAPGASPGSSLWQNADLPMATPQGGRISVTVRQTAPTAVLNWSSFNVSAKTDLIFKQGASNWVVLNRIVDDPTASPSQILGSITALGQVYVIDQNGVIFGRGVTVNLRALIASTADIPTTTFLNTGIFSPNGTQAAFANAVRSTAAITVEAGASITTSAPGSVTDGGGFVLLMGSSVTNAGSISTPGGQVVLAAGQGFILRQGFGSDPGADPKATVVGIEPAVMGGGTATNTGILQAQDGDVTIVGRSVVQEGAAISSTGVGQRGTVHLLTDLSDNAASVTLGPDSLTEILPDAGGPTAIQSLRSNTPVATTIALNDSSRLSDVPDLSRLEITSGGNVDFGAGALAMLPAGQIAVAAHGTIFAETGSVLSVAGLTGVTLPITANLFPVSIEPYNLRDSPVNRDTNNLNSTPVLVDARTLLFVPPENGDATARYYTGGGLLEVGGELGNVSYTIGQYSTVGGTITLSAAASPTGTPAVVAQTGSVFDVAGGSVTYAAGAVPQTYLQAADGQVVNLSTATDTQVYTGVYKGFVVDHTRWKVTDTYVNPLLTPATLLEPATTVGASGGALDISAPTIAFSGTIEAGVTTGEQQTTRPVAGKTALLANQTVVPFAGSLTIAPLTGATPADSEVTLAATNPGSADGLVPGRKLPNRIVNAITLVAPTLDAAGLGGITVATTGRITVDGPLAVADGGRIALYAPTVAVGASLVARGGSVTISDTYTPPGGVPGLLVGTRGKPGISLGTGTTIDARGVWTNARLDPVHVAGEAWIGGGSVSLSTIGSIALPAGSAIDVSAGGFVSPKSVVTGGVGGSVALLAGDSPMGQPVTAASFTLDGAISGYGASGGGTLTVGAPLIAIGTPGAGRRGSFDLAPALFSRGFADYQVLSNSDLSVASGTQIAVTAPALVALPTATSAPTGDDPRVPFQLELPPLFLPNPQTQQLIRRSGASLSLVAGAAIPSGSGSSRPLGNLSVGQNAAIVVDPGQSVSLSATGNELVDGSITAHGGRIGIAQLIAPLDFGTEQLWIGPDARLDVSGIAHTAPNLIGAPYGIVTAGGTIALGGGTNLPVVVSAGAVLDADGTSAVVALPFPARVGLIPVPVLVTESSAGGAIAASSISSLFIEGTLEARTGGADSAGGTLSLSLETPVLGTPSTILPIFQRYLQPRVITVTQSQPSTAARDDASGRSLLPVGQAVVSADAIEAGGFGTVSLFARDAIDFVGPVNLSAGQAIILRTEALAGTKTASQVTVSAPYVELYGPDVIQLSDMQTLAYQGAVAGDPHFPNGAYSTLTITAGLIDIRGATGIGSQGATVALVPDAVDIPGFGLVALNSTGDVRVLAGGGSLTAVDSLSVTSAQIYPETGAIGVLQAGFGMDTNGHQTGTTPGAVLTIGRLAGPAPAAPLSARGRLDLIGPTIVQGGIIRAPFGEIGIGSSFDKQGPVGQVTLLAGSITSVSADGLDIPYGGTVDGQSYTYAGAPVVFDYSGNGFGSVLYGVALTGAAIAIDPGAVIDLRGGGLLSGAGFISGRGGSTDTLLTPLLGFNATAHTVSAPVLSGSDAVYALLPTLGSAPAPITGEDTSGSYAGSLPRVGQTVTIGAGVPGLAAGTYALLPAYYAQIPGAYRVELRSASGNGNLPALAEPDGSFVVAALTGIAGTAVRNPFPVEAILTPAATVQTYSKYDTESYAAFAVAQPAVALFGGLRPHLPQDASDLTLGFLAPIARTPSLSNAGTTLDAPAPGGFGTEVSVTTQSNLPLVTLVIGTDKTMIHHDDVLLSATDLNAFGADRLDLGGYLDISSSGANGAAGDTAVSLAVTVAAGADLKAPTVVLESLGAITVQTGATIDTRGRAGNVLDSSGGILFGTGSRVYGNASALAVGNGDIHFAPIGTPEGPTTASVIDVQAGATLYTDGTVATSTHGALVIAPEAVIGAKILDLSVATVNVGDPTIVAKTEPNGLVLSQPILNALLGGNAARGIPALQELDLTASQSLNFYGTASLNTIDPVTKQSRLKLFVLNAPGIYGAGAAGQTATLTVGTLYWNDALLLTSISGNTVTIPQSLPFAVAGGPGTGAGTLRVQAQTLILGYGPNDVPYALSSQRGIFGFAEVDLQAHQMIEGTGTGSLLVYQTQGPMVATTPSAQGSLTFTGTGGALMLSAPLITGGSGSVLSITAGGGLTLTTPGGVPAVPDQSGATLSLSAASIDDSTSVVLPGGLLDLTAAGSVRLAPTARIDVAGRTRTLFDRTVAAPGGGVNLVSDTGDVTEAAGAVIDIAGGPGQDAGALSVSAAAGTVSLAGAVVSSGPDAAHSGSVSVDALVLDGFSSLNRSLTAEGVFGARSFEIGSGDLTVVSTDLVRAQSVGIAVNGGLLTIDGLIDASGTAVGSISLAGGTGLTLTSNAVLDAYGTLPVLDSYHAQILSSERAEISLTAAGGTLALDPGAVLSLAGAGQALGDLELNAPRSPTMVGDVQVSAPGPAPLAISGAATIALNGFVSYVPTSGIVTQATLDGINPQSVAFENAALGAHSPLLGHIGGLAGFGGAFHVLPGVILQSSESSHGNLDVYGDIDLSGYRYGPNATGNGAGEPGVLVLRAANDLIIAGSISDGFGNAPASPDDTGWVRFSGAEPYGQAVVLAVDAKLHRGSTFQSDDGALTYALTLKAGATLNAGVVVPVAVTLKSGVVLPQAWVTPGRIVNARGKVYAAGTTICAGERLEAGTVLDAGAALPVEVTLQKVTWPAGSDLAAFDGSNGNGLITGEVKLNAGDSLPGDAIVTLKAADRLSPYVYTRPQGAGSILPLAALLPAGSRSWTIDLVSGADLHAASLQGVQTVSSIAAQNGGTGTGNLVLDDVHYGNPVAFVACEVHTFGSCSNNGTDTSLASVIRTGTGGLSLSAGGSIKQLSPYGIYTAGTQSAPVLNAAGTNPYEVTLINPQGLPDAPAYQAVVAAQLAAGYQAYYPIDGGNVSVSAQQDIVALNSPDNTEGWQFVQGGNGVPTAWSINFGTYVETATVRGDNPRQNNPPALAAPVGFGTLGGGNVTVVAGRNAGNLLGLASLADGIDALIGSTGRVTSVSTSGTTVTGGTLVETGGGNISITVAGAFNPNPLSIANTGVPTSLLFDARGTITVSAGSIGEVNATFGGAPGDPRASVNAGLAEQAIPGGGLQLYLGDGGATLSARGDVVVDGATLLGPNLALAGIYSFNPYNNFAFAKGSQFGTYNIADTGFWLGQPGTYLNLLSEGSNVAPVNIDATYLYPPIVTVAAPYGSIYFPTIQAPVELAPSSQSALTLLAGNSIYGTAPQGQEEIALSGAPFSLDGLANPFHPLLVSGATSNATVGAESDYLLFSFESDTPVGPTHAQGPAAETIYAGTDIVNLGLGGTFAVFSSASNTFSDLYIGSTPVDVRAGRDIVGLSGLIVNDYPGDVSLVQAGRDIIYANLQVAGPGNLLLQAGRNVYQADQGVLTSVGVLAVDPAASSAGRSGGAGITVLAGVGGGPDWTQFAALYFNDANQANPEFLLSSPQNQGKVLQTYGAALLAWLQATYGYTGDQQGALAAFLALPAPEQATFVLPVYYEELRLSGREETDPLSRFFRSYARGQQAIATLFPATYQGDITLYGGSGIQTQFGGNIILAAPGGAATLGIQAATVPPASAGLITFGQGDVDVYTQGSVELGQSRVFTTFGGGITIWSSKGDINAGRGAKSTVVAQPFQLSYGPYGDITLSPSVPTTGAGIATLSEIPGTAPGDVDLIAPVGTIDAGEAGIRASGNANLAARIILNAANIISQGKTTGIPTFVSTSAAAQSAASSAAGAATQAAAELRRRAPTPEPSLIDVDVLSIAPEGGA